MGTTMRKATADDIEQGATIFLMVEGKPRRVEVLHVGEAGGAMVGDETGIGWLSPNTLATMLVLGLVEVGGEGHGRGPEERHGALRRDILNLGYELKETPEPQAKPFRVVFWIADAQAGWGDELVQQVDHLDTREEALWWEIDRMDDWQAAPTSAWAGVTVGYLQPDGTYKEIGRSARPARTMRHAFEVHTDRLGRAIL